MRYTRSGLLIIMLLFCVCAHADVKDSCSVEPTVLSSGACMISWHITESPADDRAVLWKVSPEPAGAIDHFGLKDGFEGDRHNDCFLYFGRYGYRPYDAMHFPLHPGVYEWRIRLKGGSVLSSNRFTVSTDAGARDPASVIERVAALKADVEKCSDSAKPLTLLKLAGYQTIAGQPEEGTLTLKNLMNDHGTSPQAAMAAKLLMQHEAHFHGWDSSADLMKNIATDMGQSELVARTAVEELSRIYRINNDVKGLAVFSNLYYSAQLHPAARAAAGAELVKGYYMAGKVNEALQVVKSLLDSPLEALPPAGIRSLEGIARYADWIEHDKEIVTLLEWVQSKPDVWKQVSLDTKVRLADAYAKSGRYPAAERAYKSLLDRANKEQAAYCSYALARLQQMQGMKEAARESFSAVIEDYPQVNEWTRMSRFCLALMDIEDDKIDAAERAISHLAAEQANIVELSLGYRKLAEYYEERGDANKAQEYYLKIAQNEAFEASDRVIAWETIGQRFEKAKQYSRAEQAYKEAVALFKRSKLSGACTAEMMLQQLSDEVGK